jgi:putative endonuclease
MLERLLPARNDTCDPRHALGRRGERLAARYLRRRGYRILARNMVLAGCEIDLIVRKGDTVAFVEVRTLASSAAMYPEDTVTPTKEAHIRRAAHYYEAAHDDGKTYYRYDIIAIVAPPGQRPEITHLPAAFSD